MSPPLREGWARDQRWFRLLEFHRREKFPSIDLHGEAGPDARACPSKLQGGVQCRLLTPGCCRLPLAHYCSPAQPGPGAPVTPVLLVSELRRPRQAGTFPSADSAPKGPLTCGRGPGQTQVSSVWGLAPESRLYLWNSFLNHFFFSEFSSPCCFGATENLTRDLILVNYYFTTHMMGFLCQHTEKENQFLIK